MSNFDYSNDYYDEDMDDEDCFVDDDGECAENDYMDGDHDSAMTSAGWGTDEDYGYYGSEED